MLRDLTLQSRNSFGEWRSTFNIFHQRIFIYLIKTRNVIDSAEKDLNKIKLEQLNKENIWLEESSKFIENDHVQPLLWNYLTKKKVETSLNITLPSMCLCH